MWTAEGDFINKRNSSCKSSESGLGSIVIKLPSRSMVLIQNTVGGST